MTRVIALRVLLTLANVAMLVGLLAVRAHATEPTPFERLGPCGRAVAQSINEHRVAAGLSRLLVSWQDHRTARSWSVDMRDAGVMQHSAAAEAGLYGEVVGFAPDTATLIVAWWASDLHRAILLDPLARSMGPGCAWSPAGFQWGTVVLR